MSSIDISRTVVDLQLHNDNSEAFDVVEKQRFLALMKVLCVVQIAIGLGVLVISVYLYSEIPAIFLQILAGIGLVSILVSLASYFWAKKTALQIFADSNSKKAQLASSTFTVALFNLTVLLTLTATLLLIEILAYSEHTKNIFTAQHGGQAFNEFSSVYSLLLLMSALLLLLTVVILSILAFVQFVVGVGLADLHRTGHFQNLLLLIVSLACVAATYLAEKEARKTAGASLALLHHVRGCGIAMALVSLGIFAVIARKHREHMMWAGSILVITCCILSGFNHAMFRNAEAIRETATLNWSEKMTAISTTDLQSKIGCNHKYLTKVIQGEKVYSVSCDPSLQTLVWEDVLQAPVSDRIYTTACLNADCKGVVANQPTVGFSYLSNLLFVQIALTFLVAATLYQCSLILNRKNFALQSVDYKYSVLIPIVIALGIFFILHAKNNINDN